MQVAVAHTAGDGADSHFALERMIYLDVFDGQRLLGAMKHGSFHATILLVRKFGPDGRGAAIVRALPSALLY
jgi:hypothetical protein